MKKLLFILTLFCFTFAGCQSEPVQPTYQDMLVQQNNFSSSSNSVLTSDGGSSSTTDGGSSSTSDNTQTLQRETKLATVTLKALESCDDPYADPLVFSNNGYKVTIEQGVSMQEVHESVERSGNYEFRVYKGMFVTFSGTLNFSKLIITASTFTPYEGMTYKWDFDMEGAESTIENETAVTTVLFPSSLNSFSYSVPHQVRLGTVEFYA